MYFSEMYHKFQYVIIYFKTITNSDYQYWIVYSQEKFQSWAYP